MARGQATAKHRQSAATAAPAEPPCGSIALGARSRSLGLVAGQRKSEKEEAAAEEALRTCGRLPSHTTVSHRFPTCCSTHARPPADPRCGACEQLRPRVQRTAPRPSRTARLANCLSALSGAAGQRVTTSRPRPHPPAAVAAAASGARSAFRRAAMAEPRVLSSAFLSDKGSNGAASEQLAVVLLNWTLPELTPALWARGGCLGCRAGPACFLALSLSRRVAVRWIGCILWMDAGRCRRLLPLVLLSFACRSCRACCLLLSSPHASRLPSLPACPRSQAAGLRRRRRQPAVRRAAAHAARRGGSGGSSAVPAHNHQRGLGFDPPGCACLLPGGGRPHRRPVRCAGAGGAHQKQSLPAAPACGTGRQGAAPQPAAPLLPTSLSLIPPHTQTTRTAPTCKNA